MNSVKEVAAVLEQMKIWATDKQTEAIDYAQSVLWKENPEYEYREVRSYHPSSKSSDSRLDEYLKAGYEFVRASEYIPPQNDKVGYIEYILRRKKDDSNE